MEIRKSLVRWHRRVEAGPSFGGMPPNSFDITCSILLHRTISVRQNNGNDYIAMQ